MDKKNDRKNKKAVSRLSKLGFKCPYQLILDPSFIKYMNKSNKRLKHLTAIFKSEPRLFTTSCFLKKFVSERVKYKNDISHHCKILKCKHNDDLDCYGAIFGGKNKNHYIICTSDREIIGRFKENEKVPVLSIYKTVFELNVVKKKEDCSGVDNEELEVLKRIFDQDGPIFGDDVKRPSVDIGDLELSDDYES